MEDLANFARLVEAIRRGLLTWSLLAVGPIGCIGSTRSQPLKSTSRSARAMLT